MVQVDHIIREMLESSRVIDKYFALINSSIKPVCLKSNAVNTQLVTLNENFG